MTRKRPPEQEGADRAQAASSPGRGAAVPACASGERVDPVEISGLESFPASDPPAWAFMPRKITDKPHSSCKDEKDLAGADPDPRPATEKVRDRDANE